MPPRPKKEPLIIPSHAPHREHEEELRAQSYRIICGVDEAGRGPLAGPVVAAAVILPEDYQLPALNDSKKISPKKREELYAALTSDSEVHYAIAEASVEEIDRLNILRATHLAMRRAIEALRPSPDIALIDGLAVQGLPIPHQPLVKGDALNLSIAAASILAKVARDRIMQKLDKQHPEYGFARHSGYGTAAHLTAIREHGITIQHRRTFGPVAQQTLPLEFN